MFSSSLIISTYNRPQALRLCLQSILLQSVLPSEILIADDGSTNETKTLIAEFACLLSVPLHHVWQQDNGFQLAQIRNKAFAAANGNYIIQTDGDLIFHKHFIKDHLFFAKEGHFVSGSRTLINKTETEKIIETAVVPELSFFSGGLGKRYNALRSGLLRGINSYLLQPKRNMHYVLGCNMAFWKKDLLLINGYNEEFTGWGKEDNDIAVRLLNTGKQLSFLKFGAIVFHLWHKEAIRNGFSANEELFYFSLGNSVTFVKRGMDQYS